MIVTCIMPTPQIIDFYIHDSLFYFLHELKIVITSL